MAVNRGQPDRWKNDVAASIDFYNQWFLKFAPRYRDNAKVDSIKRVHKMTNLTEQMRNVSPEKLYQHPEILAILRMCTAPPLARDRLVGLAGARKYLVKKMEKENAIPSTYERSAVLEELRAVVEVIQQMLDKDLFVWITERLLDQIFERLLRLNQDELVHHGRTYGGGLDKIEPNELQRVALGDIDDIEDLVYLSQLRLFPL